MVQYISLGYLTMTIGFWEYSEFVIISLAILAVADPVAAMIGENISKDNEFVIWKDKKNYSGNNHILFNFIFLLLLGKIAPPISKQLFVLFRIIFCNRVYDR